LLVGEANLDYRRAYDTGPENFVPSLRFDTTSDLTGEMGEATSDLLYASVAGEDVLPDVLLGRISVGDSDEARTVIGKSLRYMDAARREAWQRDVVLVADDDAAAFESFSEQLALKIPAPGTVRRFYAASYPRDRDLSSDINSAIDEGALAINFTGHGNVALWSPWPGGGRIYENADIGRLDNGPRMALFTSATCMNGWFDHPFVPVSMAEKWLRHPNGGGVSAWTPSGMVALSGPNVMLSAVFDGLFDARGVPMGALTARATARAYAVSPEWRDVIRMFVLFGDPSLVVSGGPQTPPGRVHLPRIATSIGR
jgi:hypothetical protein